ncbi:M23 family metallopeptidase [Oceanobacillus alkalisoli]|uniref:M23 family metallopeptidase n=1 Tax=Oceanobacillus alkalisoli TaxID=2925113 RepID=UPI001EE4E4B5|nr:M23 family metallopeptidase [Oceanobacillus alkalisoli]MCG5102695.1 M23 family metallopeptidase [Oceanobacillus alkalisoli]
MNEENKFGPKKRWTRIFRKRWFFPSLYLVLAALLISAVVWYQNNGDEQDIVEEWDQTDEYSPVLNDEDAEPVMEQQEVVQLPVADSEEAQIVTKFFDYNADESEKVNALIHYNNRYYQSTGIDIATEDGESFEVVAALSGTVAEVKEDPLLGNVVVIDHADDVKTYYASLGEVNVEADAEVKQGEAIGTAGQNKFGTEHGNHVHFEVRKGDTPVNPEAVLNQPLAKLDGIIDSGESTEDVADEAEESEDVTEEAEETEPAEETDAVEQPEETDEQDEDADAENDESDAGAEEEQPEDQEETEENTEE